MDGSLPTVVTLAAIALLWGALLVRLAWPLLRRWWRRRAIRFDLLEPGSPDEPFRMGCCCHLCRGRPKIGTGLARR